MSNPPNGKLRIEWVPVPEALSYRLLQKEGASGNSHLVYKGIDPFHIISSENADLSLYRVDAMLDDSEYKTIVPYATFGCGLTHSLEIEAPADSEVTAWRLVIRDETENRVLINRVSPTRSFALDKEALSTSHLLRYRFRKWIWQHARWEDVGKYQLLSVDTVAPGVSPLCTPQRRANEASRTDHFRGADCDSLYATKTLSEMWPRLDAFQQSFKGLRVLDFGCYFGDLGRQLLTVGGVREVHGVDKRPYWQTGTNIDMPAIPNLKLLAGDVLSLPEIQQESYDLIVSLDTLCLLEATQIDRVLAWFYEHILPGGMAILHTRTPFSSMRNDMATILPYCAATWIMAYRCAGFEIEHALREKAIISEDISPRLGHALTWCDQRERETAAITALLRKPAQEPDIASIPRASA